MRQLPLYFGEYTIEHSTLITFVAIIVTSLCIITGLMIRICDLRSQAAANKVAHDNLWDYREQDRARARVSRAASAASKAALAAVKDELAFCEFMYQEALQENSEMVMELRAIDAERALIPVTAEEAARLLDEALRNPINALDRDEAEYARSLGGAC